VVPGGGGGAQLFFRGSGCNGVENFVIESKLLSLNLWQPLQGLKRRYSAEEFRLHVVIPFVGRHEGRSCHPYWPIAPRIERFENLDSGIDG